MEGRYHEKISEYQKLIRLHPDKKDIYEQAMYNYIAECMPFIKEFTTQRDGGIQRKDIYNMYMEKVENISQDIPTKLPNDEYVPCPQCKSVFSMILDDSTSNMVCTKCGVTEFFLGREAGFKEEQDMDRYVVYSYKRENHFNEWVNQFQAKESTTVPNELIEQLKEELRKRRVKNTSEITHRKVREMLKKIHMNKYYEHAPYITTILNGVQPPTMPQALEDRLRLMFGQVQTPFEKHCPANRKNFLSYSYVLYKFCELLGEDSYLPCFPLLKSKEKLYKHDAIWKKITDDLGWEYIPTAISS